MLTHILAFILGIGVGAGMFIANKKSVDQAVAVERNRSRESIERLKREHIRIIRERDDLLREREWNEAYSEGRKSPLSDVEKFADTLERRKVKLGDTSGCC